MLFLFKQSESPSVTCLSNKENSQASEILLASGENGCNVLNSVIEDLAFLGLSALNLEYQLILKPATILEDLMPATVS